MHASTFVRLSLSVVAFAASASVVCAQELVGVKESTFTLSEKVNAGGWVRFYSQSGDITITEGSGSTVELRAEKDVRRGKIEDLGFIVRRDGDGLTVCAVYIELDGTCTADGMRDERRGGWRGNWRDRGKVHMTIRLPHGMHLRAGSGNGDISVNASALEARITSGNGKVRVAGVDGRVEATSGNGEVSVEGAGGAVRASSGNGDVTVTTSVGPVNASSGNGDLRISMGKLSSSEDLDFSTGNGRIILDVPSDFSADVDANTGNGRVTTDFPITIQGRLSPNRLRGKIGNGGRHLTMSSGNGALEIRKVDSTR
ncbi:MAG: DUF4097 family beta strand repeat-containing protein [Gemmatimonadaceae bacterium]